MAHDQPTYASVPGIRVFGMMCIKPGAGANRNKPPQVPKRDGIHQYQQQQQQHVKQTYQQQYQSHQPQPQSSGYNAPQQLQQQYQPNYQYLHRATSDRPVPSQSTPRSNSYLPHHVYQQQQQQLSHSNVNQFEYDDVYARNGAGIDAVSPDTASSAASASSGSSSSSAATSAATAAALNSATTYAANSADTASTLIGAAGTTVQQAAGETYTAAVQADTTVPTPVAATVADENVDEAPTATDSSGENADSNSSSSSSVETSEGSDRSSSSSETGADQPEQPLPIAVSRKRRAARDPTHQNLVDDDRLQAKLEAIVDQLLHSTDGGATAAHGRHRQMRTTLLASSIIEQAKRQM